MLSRVDKATFSLIEWHFKANIMTLNEKVKLLLLCGALHDVAEKTKEETTQRQLVDIISKIELIVISDADIINSIANLTTEM